MALNLRWLICYILKPISCCIKLYQLQVITNNNTGTYHYEICKVNFTLLR